MKQKSLSSAKKRVRFTATGKIKMMKAGRRHLLQQKSKKQKLLGKVGKAILVPPSFEDHVRKALPYYNF